MTTTHVPIETFTSAVRRYAEALGAYQEEINGLNVYPVPDGDTGTNLRLTLVATCRDLDGAEDACATIIRGSLMGARGNSGVILSQIFRGLCEAVRESGDLTPASLAEGLRRGTDLAYQAVMKPQEGTILTVVREAAEEAEAASDDGEDVVEAVRRVVGRAQDALDRTPEMLPILKQAGVVDAGGRGLLLFLEVLLNSLDDSPLPPAQVPERSPAEAVQGDSAEALQTGGSQRVRIGDTPNPGRAATPPDPLEFAFEVQFLFEAPDSKADEYRDLLHRYGDCVLVVGGAGMYNVHIHTNDVGPVIEEAIERGRPRQIEVTHLEGQVAAQHEAAVLARMQSLETADTHAPLDPYGCVAVASGSGILEILRSLGVKGLVPGGQTFNPSAEEILVGIRQAHAEQVIVLPNNKNVIGSARTAAQIAVDEGVAKRVEVVPTESPLQGFTALVAFDGDATLEDNLEAMTREGLATKHGEVAYAVRTTQTPAGHVEQGQCLGLAAGVVKVVADEPPEAVVGVLEAMLAPTDSLVTLVYGADTDEWSAHELGKIVAERFSVEVEVHHGGQPHYPFLIGIE